MILSCALAVVACFVRSVLCECGKPAIQPDVGNAHFPSFIVNGREAVPHSWPWQVQLRYKDYQQISSWGGLCGGSIVTPYHILTAARCFIRGKDPKDWKVLIGAHNDAICDGKCIWSNVGSIEVHPNYTYNSYNSTRHLNRYDIAIVSLTEPIEFNDDVLDVCLNTNGFNYGTRCFVTGYGLVDSGTPPYANELNQVDLYLYPTTMCQVLIGFNDIMDDTMICAYNRQMWSGECVGDEGGPLVCQNDKGVWFLQGISSRLGCGYYPDVYTRVPHFYKWIESKIRMSY